MVEKFDHTVLVVDDEEQVGKSLGRFLKSIGIKYVYMESGKLGLERMQTASKPFSLIISDQRMPGMTGSEFLGKAKEISPDTIRFLLTGYSEMDAITEAVNKGSIHKYISKPWDNKDFKEKIKSGLNQFELAMENDRLFKLAKDQNSKLFQLNKDLKESSVTHGKTLAQLNGQIDQLNARLDKGFANRDYVNEIESILKEYKMLDKEKLNFLYSTLLTELYEQFQDIATRNGFEMPKETG
ncbi:MAG: response regulator [Desulfobacteraceae bacterium]|nr:response regulator [Desulfobacteraceae bacterium]